MLFRSLFSNSGRPPVTDDAGIQFVKDITVDASQGGTSELIAVSATNAQSEAISSGVAIVTPRVDVYMRQGADPEATADGSDQLLLANVAYRVKLTPGNKLAFKAASDAGNVHLTPAA